MTRPVYLVTDNWKDFASDKAGDKLAPPLQGDVDAVSGDLRLFRSLFDVLAVIAPADDLVALLEQDFADETGPYEQLVSRIEASYDRLDASNVEVGGLEDVDEIFPEYLEIVTIQVVNASHRGEGRYVVELEVEANVDLYASGYTEVEEDDEDDFGGWITRYRYRLVSRTKSATVSFAVDCEYDRPSEEFVDLTLGVARGRVEF